VRKHRAKRVRAHSLYEICCIDERSRDRRWNTRVDVVVVVGVVVALLLQLVLSKGDIEGKYHHSAQEEHLTRGGAPSRQELASVLSEGKNATNGHNGSTWGNEVEQAGKNICTVKKRITKAPANHSGGTSEKGGVRVTFLKKIYCAV
jgi:hypothetical protein